MTVKISTIDNGARNGDVPYIHATVDGTRVRFIEREDEDFIGWRCDQHGDADPHHPCDHAHRVTLVLARRIIDRIRALGYQS